MRKALLKSFIGAFALGAILSITPVAAADDFEEDCGTYGFHGIDDIYVVELIDKSTGKRSDDCVATDWEITGDTDVVTNLEEEDQEIQFRIDGEGGINVKAINGDQSTADNYLYIRDGDAVEESEGNEDFREDCTTFGFYGIDDLYVVELRDRTTNRRSDDCVATDWKITANTSAITDIDEEAQQVMFRVVDDGGINVIAFSGEYSTFDNYLYVEEDPEQSDNEDFSEECTTFGFYGIDDLYVVELRDIDTNRRSEDCVATSWRITGNTDAVDNVREEAQQVIFRRVKDGGINVIARNDSESTGDNYLYIRANSDILPWARFEEEVIDDVEEYENPFSDTDPVELEGKAASELNRRGVLAGYADGEFKGDQPVTRAEAAKILLVARYETVKDESNTERFDDVRNGDWFVKYVIRAARLGIIQGYQDGLFRPGDTVSTAEFLKMLTRTFDLETGLDYSYSDVDEDDWFAEYAGTAEEYELFPDRDEELYPDEDMSRKEVAIAIYQYLKNRD